MQTVAFLTLSRIAITVSEHGFIHQGKEKPANPMRLGWFNLCQGSSVSLTISAIDHSDVRSFSVLELSWESAELGLPKSSGNSCTDSIRNNLAIALN